MSAAKTHLVRVQEGTTDDVLADVGCRGQAVQAVEQLYTRDVMLLGLLVQLIPKHMSHSLDGGGDSVNTGGSRPFPPCGSPVPAPRYWLLPTFAMGGSSIHREPPPPSRTKRSKPKPHYRPLRSHPGKSNVIG